MAVRLREPRDLQLSDSIHQHQLGQLRRRTRGPATVVRGQECRHFGNVRNNVDQIRIYPLPL